jgi:hypothetical protein
LGHYLIVVNTSTVSAIQAKKRGGKAGKVLEARKFTCRDCKRCFKIRVESNTAFPSVLLWSLCDLAIGPSDNHPSNCQTWEKKKHQYTSDAQNTHCFRCASDIWDIDKEIVKFIIPCLVDQIRNPTHDLSQTTASVQRER